MTEEQRKDAMMALGRIVLSIEGLKMDYKQDVQTIIYALQSPHVPVIDGLEEAIWRMDGQDKAGDEFGHEIMSAARAYAKLQKEVNK